MSRRKSSTPRKLNLDPRYQDVVLVKFINKMMFDGKKGLAQKVIYKAMDRLKAKRDEKDTKRTEQPVEIFRKAIENVKPHLEVRSRRVGGATYQIPVEVRPVRRQALAIRWIIRYARDRNEKTMADRLAGELWDAYHQRGASIKKAGRYLSNGRIQSCFLSLQLVVELFLFPCLFLFRKFLLM